MFELMPFSREERRLFNAFGNFGRDFFSELDHSLIECKADIMDKNDKYVLRAQLPGFTREDIHIDIDGDCLTLHAEHKNESDEEKDSYIRRECAYGAYARRFDISGIKADEIKARYENGVLELDMPKKDYIEPAKRNITIE
ncbi:MAG: Hsp20 family protein [Oscillospiraceae bacterium]